MQVGGMKEFDQPSLSSEQCWNVFARRHSRSSAKSADEQ
jgi:hypothetical protein